MQRVKNQPVIILLDEDVAKVFQTTEQVHKVLHALISAMSDIKVKAKNKILGLTNLWAR